jgi:serine/threonine-protein kinase
VAAQNTLLRNGGRCQELVAGSRRLIALAPGFANGYRTLAEGLLGVGEPVDAVRAALKQCWERMPAETRATTELLDEAALAVLSGALGDAERAYRDAEARIPSDEGEWLHYRATYPRVLVEQEIGAGSVAQSTAAQYLRRRSAWPGEEQDRSMWLLAAEHEGGGLALDAFAKLRDAWLDRNRDLPPGVRWVDGYAVGARTPAEASAALAVIPAAKPLVGATYMTPEVAEAIGNVQRLGGRLDEAVPLLERASEACALLDSSHAIASTRASLELGLALAERGDGRGACDAYARVLRRWGSAKPRSLTATKAMKESAALRCP